ncbi:Aspartyl protease [Kriegella aquimaris]|uniref:Aspartyl protease n=1 Tax=Kriegella aquimaris TaxID=192904 RepID=A0A1G9X5X1_9FLAO|nr:Aspartyl protease [Kriegella aquimaris]
MKNFLTYYLFLVLCIPFVGSAQGYSMPMGQRYEKVRFQLVNNLIIIPVSVNGTELSFILDSGVSSPILFNLSDQDSVQINNVSEIRIKGLGQGEPIDALSSNGNVFELKSVVNRSQPLYVVMDRGLNFSPSLGIPIHGIIGYDLFKDFIVDINYVKKIIKFHDPRFYRHRKGRQEESLALTVFKKKAYINGTVYLNERGQVPVKLLLDTGSSDAIWLFEDEDLGIPDKNYDDFLGIGLSGQVFGKRTMVNRLSIGGFILKDAKAAFPSKESFNNIKNLGDRNGSIGGEMLKRFNIVFDYPNNKIVLRKNKNFNTPFQYNMSGIDLQHNGVRYISESIADSRGVVQKEGKSFGDVQILFENRTRISLVPEIIVSGIRAGSPADEAGLKAGDIILSVNGKSIHRYKLQEVMQMLNEKDGKKIKVRIARRQNNLLFSFVLKHMFK